MEKWSDYYDTSNLNYDKIQRYDKLLMDVQLNLLSILEDIDGLCRDNGINYTLLGGSLLGAIRHKGFIPWDDDIDIAMPREDIELFHKVFNKKNDNRYVIEREELWVWRIKERATRNEKNQPQIDLFAIDAAPNNKVLFNVQIIILKILQGMIKKKVSYKDKTFFQNLLQFITFNIGKIIRYETKIKWYDYISQLGNRSKTNNKYVFVSNDQYSYVGNRLKRESVSRFKRIKFNNLNPSIMIGWKECLTKWYGENYMELPPIEKRKPEHIIELDTKD